MLFATGGTMDLLGIVIARTIKRQQVVPPEYREVFQPLRALQVGKGRTQMDRINPVEMFPQAGVRRGLINAKEVPDIRQSMRVKPQCLTGTGTAAKTLRTVDRSRAWKHAFESVWWTWYCSIFEFVLVC